MYFILSPFLRFTPAYAGNTNGFNRKKYFTWDHPRLRGEHLVAGLKFVVNMGSPPPTRGTLYRWFSNGKCRRITPAYAGNTQCVNCDCCVLWDHPRLRGEHIKTQVDSGSPMGSPPPTRGTLLISHANSAIDRITPAYAGNTRNYCMTTCKAGDHPRLRGEHRLSLHLLQIFLGSPPPTRGTPSELTSSADFPRITPAYAGNTQYNLGEPMSRRDHPRLRGEHSITLIFLGSYLGSPPPTRGTHL